MASVCVVFVLDGIFYVSLCFVFICFFFKQKTAYEMRISDWSSDVCSSDLMNPSECGFQDRLVVQEVIKEIAQSQPIESASGGRTFKVVVLNEVEDRKSVV